MSDHACRECQRSTSGRCAAHASWTIYNPTQSVQTNVEPCFGQCGILILQARCADLQAEVERKVLLLAQCSAEVAKQHLRADEAEAENARIKGLLLNREAVRSGMLRGEIDDSMMRRAVQAEAGNERLKERAARIAETAANNFSVAVENAERASKAEAENAALRQALVDFGQHTPACERFDSRSEHGAGWMPDRCTLRLPGATMVRVYGGNPGRTAWTDRDAACTCGYSAALTSNAGGEKKER